MGKLYRVQEFAELAGLTVRALHHYDRLGLLKPSRTENGYRLYAVRDLERLEQIVALKFLGLPLKQIKHLLDRNSFGLHDALRLQRSILEQKRRLLDSALDAIAKAEHATESGKAPDAALLKNIIEVIEMQNNTDWMMKYYSDEGKAKVEARRHLWSPEKQEVWSKQWSDLFRDVEAILDQDPAGEAAQSVLARWTELVEGFTAGDPDIAAGVRNVHADAANWPADMRENMKPFSNKKVWEFIHKARAARKT